ncbi:MAG: hypothetical protein AAGA77_13505 [Bacteroidota bacterium]
MKLNIPYYIRQVLREQRMVHIPGIGTLRLHQISSEFNDDKSEISPPSLTMTFDDTDSDDNALKQYIMDTGLYAESKVQKKIQQYTQAAFNSLLNVDSFLIEGVGKIVKRDNVDKVELEPHVSDLTKEFSNLPTVGIVPIARIAEEPALAFAATESKPVEESGSFLPRILLIALMLIALYFLGRYIRENFFNPNTEVKTEASPPLNEKEDEAAVDELNAEDLEQKYEEIDELIDPDKAKENKVKSESNLNKNETENTPEQKEQTAAEENNEDVLKTQQPSSGLPNSPDSTAKENSAEPSKNKHAEIIPASGECIIVVGSFIKSMNVIKMVSLLERKGYEVYQSEYKGLQRVGITYECADEDLEEYLHDIRKTISKKAWYLDPDLEVPYKSK